MSMHIYTPKVARVIETPGNPAPSWTVKTLISLHGNVEKMLNFQQMFSFTWPRCVLRITETRTLTQRTRQVLLAWSTRLHGEYGKVIRKGQVAAALTYTVPDTCNSGRAVVMRHSYTFMRVPWSVNIHRDKTIRNLNLSHAG
jgi:hypothetical protein